MEHASKKLLLNTVRTQHIPVQMEERQVVQDVYLQHRQTIQIAKPIVKEEL